MLVPALREVSRVPGVVPVGVLVMNREARKQVLLRTRRRGGLEMRRQGSVDL